MKYKVLNDRSFIICWLCIVLQNQLPRKDFIILYTYNQHPMNDRSFYTLYFINLTISFYQEQSM